MHKNYNNRTREDDISILELSESIVSRYTYPAVLPQTPLDLHHGKLHVAFNEGDSRNASIWSNDECLPELDHKIDSRGNFLCIEVTDACDHFSVKHSIIEDFFPQDNHLVYIAV